MHNLIKKMESVIKKKYGSRKNWLDDNEIHSQRFYNFLKGDYRPQISTLVRWLDTLDLELCAKEKRPTKAKSKKS